MEYYKQSQHKTNIADTSWTTVPAVEQTTVDTALYKGDTLLDGTVVNDAGIYEVIKPNAASDGCDLLVTYNVDLLTATNTVQRERNRIVPITTDKIHLEGAERRISGVRIHSGGRSYSSHGSLRSI